MHLHWTSSHLKTGPLPGHDGADDDLVAALPLEEEAPGPPVRHAGLVVPHEVPAHKVTVVTRVQSGVQQERVILRSVSKGNILTHTMTEHGA